MNNQSKLGESAEMYLEAILVHEKEGKARCIDVANHLHVTKPSVNKAMNSLKELGYVQQETYGDIYLTDAGRLVANKVYSRHEVLHSFLSNILKVSNENAENDACKIEHVICDETLDKIIDYMKNH